MRIVVWAPEITPHLVDTFTELQRQNGNPILYVTWEKITQLRKDQGWQYQNEVELKVLKINKNQWWRQGCKILKENSKAIHLFVGFWTIRAYFPLILHAISHNIKISIMNEPYSIILSGYNEDGNMLKNLAKVMIRPIAYWFAAKIINFLSKKEPPCIFAISLLAKEQFSKLGFKPETIYPFGYFIDRSDSVNSSQDKRDEKKLRLIFVGSLIFRKGLDTAISALRILNEKGVNVEFDIYGPGNINKYQVDDLPNVKYCGVIPLQETQLIIANYDLLILPSYHEGWGVVTNEALLQGVPVILSDRVGSKCLVESSSAGVIFKSGNPSDLVGKIISIATDPSKLSELRSRAKEVAEEIQPAKAAEYILKVLQFHYENKTADQRPCAIWCK